MKTLTQQESSTIVSAWSDLLGIFIPCITSRELLFPNLGAQRGTLQFLADVSGSRHGWEQASVGLRGIHWGYIGIMENQMETTRVYRDSIGYIMVQFRAACESVSHQTLLLEL